jgi:alpha/beta superfamily hydrolase
MTTGPLVISVEPGISLEARWDAPAEPEAVAVLCHPHPLYGGSMQVPLLRTVATALATGGCAVLRFNFRGVGASTGTWSGGPGELADLAASIATARAAFPGLPLGLAGWSFGAVVALCWQRDRGSRHRLAAIAPPTRGETGPALPDPSSLAPAPRLFLVGSRDQFAEVAVLEQYAGALGARLQVLPGSDHFFFGREHRVGEAVAAHLAAVPGA